MGLGASKDTQAWNQTIPCFGGGNPSLSPDTMLDSRTQTLKSSLARLLLHGIRMP